MRIVELAHPGRPLAPLLLHHLAPLVRDTPSLPPFRYVVALLEHGAIARWRDDEVLAPWIERGGVALGRVDIDRAELVVGDRAIRPGDLDELLVIADEALGAWPQAAWRIQDGDAEPLCSSEEQVAAEDALLDDELVVATCTRRLRSADLLLPIRAFRALDALQELAGGRLTFLTTDRGAEEIGDLEGASLPTGPTLDHAALRLYAALRGGSVMSEGGLSGGRVSTMVEFGQRSGASLTRAAWRRAAQAGELDLQHASYPSPLATLRAHAWDPVQFHTRLPEVLAILGDLSRSERRALERGAVEVAGQLRPDHDPLDGWFDLGRLLAALGYPDAATRAIQRSVRQHGPSMPRLTHLAACATAMNRLQEAERYRRAARESSRPPEKVS